MSQEEAMVAVAGGQSKYDAYDHDIFTAEPPAHDKLTKSLFCGREKELQAGRQSCATPLT